MARYTNIPIVKSTDKKRVYATVRYPEIRRSFEDTYVYTTIGDRYDTLALQYYGDSSLWWIISSANGSLVQDSLTPPLGTQLRIPPNPTPIIAEYENINQQSSIPEQNNDSVSGVSTGVNNGGGSIGGGSMGGGGY